MKINCKSILTATLITAALALSPTLRAVPPNEGDAGNGNTVEGFQALFSNTTGTNNTALGFQALFSDSNASFNTAVGHRALYSNTSGPNTATGDAALYSNTTGDGNTATGHLALFSNTTGFKNTATGDLALYSNTTGSQNVAIGRALVGNTTGFRNTAAGFNALDNNTTGSHNIALGDFAGTNLTTGDNNIDIGSPGMDGDSGTIRIGQPGHFRAFIVGIAGSPIAGLPVVVNPSGQLGVTVSSARFKNEIKPIGDASEVILALKPVSFCYKHEVDPSETPQFGLIAEEVAKVNPDLVSCDADGKPYTVRYEAVNAMLLNEFLKEHQKVQKLEAALATVNQRLKEQDVKIDKVSVKVELTQPALQTAEK